MDNQSTQPVAASADASNDKLMAILSYLWILVLVPILAAKDSKFAMYHANQGLWLLIINIVLGVLSVIPVIGCIAMILFLVTLVYAILGIVNAANNKMEPLPGFASLPVLIK